MVKDDDPSRENGNATDGGLNATVLSTPTRFHIVSITGQLDQTLKTAFSLGTLLPMTKAQKEAIFSWRTSDCPFVGSLLSPLWGVFRLAS